MVERRRELNARYTRTKKMRKLKAQLVAPGSDREKILAKIRKMSPWWTEASLEQAKSTAPMVATPKEDRPDEPKKKAPPKPKAKA